MASKWRTAVLVNLAMVVEQANEVVLPSVYLFVGRSLNATPVQLGTLTLCRAMVQTLSSPLSGILGDRYDRILVLSTGAFIWAIMTSAMALTVTLRQAMMFAALNGVGLALLVPCCQSLIADLYPAEQRGRAFGTLQLTASLGGMLGGVFATNMGGHSFAGLDGWRVAFHTIAALSLGVGALALTFATDPRRLKYSLLTNSTDVVHALLGSEQYSPASSCSNSSSTHDTPAAAITASPGGLFDRRRPGLPHTDQAGAVLHNPTTTTSSSSSSGKGMLYHNPGSKASQRHKHSSSKHSSWHDLQGGNESDNDDAGDDVLTTADTNMAGCVDDSSSADSERDVLLHRPVTHVTLTVSRQGIQHTPGEQLLSSSGIGQPKQHHYMLHTQQSLQQRSTAPTSGKGQATSVHQHNQQQQQQVAGGGSSSAGSSPRKGSGVKGGMKFKRRGVVADVCWMLRIRTFQAIVLQGIVGCFPWQAMVFFTLWLQLTGFSNATSSLLVATFGAGVAMGALIGGSIGDLMAKKLPNNGRIFTAQISVFCGIPLTWVILKGLPASSYATTPAAYAAFMFVMGSTCTWAGAGCNSPIFAEIVPDELRSTIYAFDRSFENSIAACAAPVVGLLAERVFGFTGVLTDEALKDDALRTHNAAALGSSLLACMTVPWALCLLAYSVLHWFYPRDRAMAKAWASSSGGSAALYMH